MQFLHVPSCPCILTPNLFSSHFCFIYLRTVSVGPRLSSLMLDITEEGQATLDEARRTLCLPPDVTVELCAFVLHDSMNLLTDFPFNTKLSEYGFLVIYKNYYVPKTFIR